MTVPARGPLASTGYWLHHAALRWRLEFETRLREVDLTPTQFNVLAAVSWLSRTEGSPTQQSAADFAGIDRMMTSKVLDILQRQGLVTKTADSEDARARRLGVTDLGRAIVVRAAAIARSVDADLFGALPDGEALREALQIIASSAPGASLRS